MTFKYNELKRQMNEVDTERSGAARQFSATRTQKYDDQEFYFLKQIANSFQCINDQSKQKQLFLNQVLTYPINFEF